MKYEISTYLKYINDVTNRNEFFPFFIGLLIVAGGSASTVFYYIAGIYVIFLNPKIRFNKLSLQTLQLYKQVPLLTIFPLFVLSLFLFSIGRENPDELLRTIASHFQLLLIAPMVVGMLAISKSQNCVRYFINGLRVGILIILPVAVLQIVVFSMRPEGFSGNSLVFAFVLSLACALCLLKDELLANSKQMLNYVPSVCAFFIVIISFSRAPILVAFILILVTLLFFVKQSVSLKTFLSIILFFVMSITIGVASIASTGFGARYFDKRIVEPIVGILNGEILDNSIKKRIDLNRSGFYAFTVQPLVGYGLQNTVKAANDVSIKALGAKTEYDFSHLHNEYLTYAVTGGLALLFQYLIIIVGPLLIWTRAQRRTISPYFKQFSILITLGFAAIAFTNVVLGHDIMSTFVSICIILITIKRVQRDKIEALDVRHHIVMDR